MSDAPITAQIASNAPIPSGLNPVTAPLLPDQGVLTQMSNFPPQTYNLNLGASIVKLMSTLTGPSGGGQLRQRSLMDRLRSSVSSTHFTDLDNSLGAVLGISRQLSENLPFNPYTTAAPSTGPQSWAAMAEADATYRDRLFQVLRAVSTYGPSPLGIQLIAESFLLAPCEVTEYFRSQPQSALIANPSLAYYIVVTPHVAPTQQQRYGLMKILNKIKPAQATITLAPAPAVNPYLQVPLGNAWASSFYWEVQSISSSPSIYGSNAVPQYAFGSSQAATWTMNGWVSGVLSYALNPDGSLSTPSDFEQITWTDGTITNYSPMYALAPASEAILGTMVVPGNATANPINSDNSTVSSLLLSGASVEAIQSASTITAQSVPQFWSTPERDYTDLTQEIIEIRFSSPVNVNAISFQVANFPQTATFQVFDEVNQAWVSFYSQTVTTSVPAVLPNPTDALAAKTHPQHFGNGHWLPVAFRCNATVFSRARITFFRPGPAGPTGPISAVSSSPGAYSLGVTELSFDYVVDSANQLPDQGTVSLETIGTSTDVAGNTVTYSVYSEVPNVTNGALTQWRCFPQPVNNAVALLYLDTRNSGGNAQVIDRFFVTPTHLGVGCTLYFAIEEPATTGDMTTVPWILLNRSYILTTGWMVVPPIAAKYWKFEMSGLVAEPLQNPFPVTTDILMFGNSAINPTTGSAGYQGALPAGATTQSTMAAGETALTTPNVTPPASGNFSAATALVASDPTLAQALQSNFANYGYIDWQPFGAPPATLGGLDDYTTTTIGSVNTVGFFTGFSSIVAYRSNPACPIDTALYYELFYDQAQIASSNAVTVGGIYSGAGTPPYPDNNPQSELLATPVVVTSKAYVSASMVNKVQFATEQSPPTEVVPFDTFRNGRYLPPPQGTYAWDDQSDWNIVGMGDTTVNFDAQTLTPVIVRGQTAYHGAQANGLVSGPFLTAPVGWVTFAVRLSILSVPPGNPEFFAQHPIYLQVCQYNGNGTAPTVLVEWALTATSPGQTIEEYFSYQVGSAINPSTFLCLAVAQHSGATVPAGQSASWVVQAASGFDPSMMWSFSSDGTNWVQAGSVNFIKNNRNGIVSLPNPSTNLYWRVTLYRPDMYINVLKIRPWYQGTDRPRVAPVMSGPNMSFSDTDQTIWTDPFWRTTGGPVPLWWFSKYQQNTFLYPEGVPIVTRGSKVYVLAMTETVGPAHDTAIVTYYRQMYSLPQAVGPASDVATAQLHSFHAGNTEVLGPASDVATATVTALVPYQDVYFYTGGAQTFTVPLNVQPGSNLVLTVAGGGGGGSNGGSGGAVQFSFPATPGQVLNIYVGGCGSIIGAPATQGGRVYGYHEGGAPYLMNGATLTYGQTGPYGTLGFGGSSSGVALSNGTLIAEAGGGGGQGWVFACQESTVNQNFFISGGVQTWTLPATSGVLTITAVGGSGGSNGTSTGPGTGESLGGQGGEVQALLNTNTGDVLTVYVGYGGANGGNAGGVNNYAGFGYHEGGYANYGGCSGGSSSAVLLNGTLVIEAGAGGGSGGGGPANYYYGGGNGGNPNGANGVGPYGGGGATQSAGGGVTIPGTNTPGTVGGPPQSINGGLANWAGDMPDYGACGGGGGGFAGGGAGTPPAAANYYGGGGGSSWAGNGAYSIGYTAGGYVGHGEVLISYYSTNTASPYQSYALAGGAGGQPGAGGGTGNNFGSAQAGGGVGGTLAQGGAGGPWTSAQPSGTTSGNAPAGSLGGGINAVNGGESYPFSGGGGGGGGHAGGGAGAYAIYHALGAWNTNMWGAGGGGSSLAGNGATNISYGLNPNGVGANGNIWVSYNTNGPRRYS